mmetsp:Transcript_72778/g.194243  ORF Transcript_72778/g.194243 Transcript_72778/m.194243 type:complete len:304 (-) Transcript_72778:264-1175(-)
MAVGPAPEAAMPYVFGAVAIGMALRVFESDHALVVLVEEGHHKAIQVLEAHCANCIPREVTKICKDTQFPQWSCAYTRLRIFEMIEYQKVVALDADTLPLTNIDELFDVPALAMSRNRCGLCCTHGPGKTEFTSGLLVVEPNLDDFAVLVRAVDSSDWDAEHQLIQNLLSVRSAISDVYDPQLSNSLRSCGCDPTKRTPGYLRNLTKSPYQHLPVFGGEALYWPGVSDAVVRTVHMNYPKPWELPLSRLQEAPCGQQFLRFWWALVEHAVAGGDPRVLVHDLPVRLNRSIPAFQALRISSSPS